MAQEPPDAAAYQAAYRLKEPKAKLAALDRFLIEYPSSRRAASARRELIVAAVKLNPKDAVRRTRKLVEALEAADAAVLNRLLAAELNSAGQRPADAERAARRAVEQFTIEAFAGQVTEEPALRTRFLVQRAQMSETLGQILMKRGRTEQAKEALLSALKDNPSLGAAGVALGDIAFGAGDLEEALRFYAHGLLARGTAEARRKFAAAYLKVKGSAAGQDGFLDERYRALFPSPLHPAKYEKSGTRTARVALAEVYTGAGCGPCLGADLAFDAVLERYGRGDVAVVMYHEHIPRPDPMANADTLARWKWQAAPGIPTYAIDGTATSRGGSRADAAELEARIRQMIERRLEAAPAAAIELSAVNDGRAVTASAAVAGVGVDSPDLALNVVLVERELRYSGENGIRFHPMVARSIASFPLGDSKALAQKHVFDLADVRAALERHIAGFELHDERHNLDGQFRFVERMTQIDAGNLGVVAFVQDTRSREVLQAAYVEAQR